MAWSCAVFFGAVVPGSALAGSGLELARGRPAWQSSTYGTVPASAAVDGNTDGYGAHVVTHTQYEQWAWWQVDLGASRVIGSVDVWNRTDCCGERLQNFYVFVSPVPFTSNDPEVTRTQPGVKSYLVQGQGGTPTTATFGAGPARGRFVRVQLRGTNYLSLAEVKVWGFPEHQDFDGDGRSDITAWSPNAGAAWGIASYEMLPQGNVATYGFDNLGSDPMTARHFRLGGPAQYEMLQGDIDGDGRSDLATLSSNGGSIWPTSIDMDMGGLPGFWTRTVAANMPIHMRNGGSARYVTLSGDFNGDGRSDLATLSPNGQGGWSQWFSVELSTGSGYSSQLWAAATPVHMRNGGTAVYRTLTGDFNGDGRTDVATISPNGGGGWAQWVSMELSTGTGFSSAMWATPTPFHMRNGASASVSYETFVGDFNGDGRSDLATLSRDGGGAWASYIMVDLSTGSGFTHQWWAANTPIHMRNGGSPALYTVFTGDFDGNGLTDFATLSPNGGGGWRDWYSVELSTGSGFRSELWPSATPIHMRNGGATARYLTVTGDYNQDGRTDLVTLSPDGGGSWTSNVHVDLSTGTGSFTGFFKPSSIPGAMRSGGSSADYFVLSDTPAKEGLRFDEACSAYAVRRVRAPLVHKWNLLGRQLHWLGCPTSDAIPSKEGGDYQLFEGGRLYTSAFGTFAVHGAILSKWLATCTPGTSACGVDSYLSHPTGDEVVTPDGFTTQSFVGGVIQSSSAGTFAIPTAIHTAWLRNGGQAALGRALADPVNLGTGARQSFQNAEVYASEHGAYAVRGAILARWMNHPQGGGSLGPLAYPVSDEKVYPDGGRLQSFWEGGRNSTITSHPAYGTFLVHGDQWLKRGGPEGDNGWGTAIGWPRGEERRYSDYPEMAPECSLHASRMYQQDYAAGTTCFFQDAAPQLEFLPHPVGDSPRDCHKSALNPYRNPNAPCFPTYTPPATYTPAPPEWGCNRGYVCSQGPTYATTELFGQRQCGCSGDFSPTSTTGTLVVSVAGWLGSGKRCDGHPMGTAECRQAVQAILNHLNTYGGELGRRYAQTFNDQPSHVEFVSLGGPAGAAIKDGDIMRIEWTKAYTPRWGAKEDKDMLAAVFAHEVHHLRQGSVRTGSIYGETEAYLIQYEIQRELGYDHCTQALLSSPCFNASYEIWNYYYVLKGDIWTEAGLKLVQTIIPKGNEKDLDNDFFGTPPPPARYDDKNRIPQGFTGPNNCTPPPADQCHP